MCSQSIYYSTLIEQQRKRAEYASKSKNTDRKRIMAIVISKLWMYIYRNQQAIRQGRMNQDETGRHSI